MKMVVLDKSQVVDLQQVKSDKVYGCVNLSGEKMLIKNTDLIEQVLKLGFDVFEFYSMAEFDEWFEQA